MKGNIDILYNNGDVLIKVLDGLSSETLFETKIDPETFLQASMGRLSRTKVEYEHGELSRIGKKMVVEKLVFEVPKRAQFRDIGEVIELANAACPEGWIHDGTFNSQGSFFHEKGVDYAKTVMRQWVDVE